MKTTYSYTILKYRHSQVLGEVINIGLLFFHPESKLLKFEYPGTLKRLSHLYPDFSIPFINRYLKAFHSRAGSLSKHINNSFLKHDDKTLKSFVSEYFLVEDDSALFFDEPHTGLTEDPQIELGNIVSVYLGNYDIDQPRNRKDEEYIKQTIVREFRERSNKDIEKLRINRSLSNNRITEKFEFGWKNGTYNLIAPVSFDLLNSSNIQEKGIKWYGTISLLSDEIENSNAKIDIITVKPANIEFLNDYNKAINNIKDASGNKEIIDENELPEYIDHVLNYI